MTRKQALASFCLWGANIALSPLTMSPLLVAAAKPDQVFGTFSEQSSGCYRDDALNFAGAGQLDHLHELIHARANQLSRFFRWLRLTAISAWLMWRLLIALLRFARNGATVYLLAVLQVCFPFTTGLINIWWRHGACTWILSYWPP